jgi:hypothetical protein
LDDDHYQSSLVMGPSLLIVSRLLPLCSAVLLSSCLIACLATPLPLTEQPKDFQRLTSLARQTIQCRVEGDDEETVVGHQFFLGIFPLGRIKSPSPQQAVLRALELAGAIRSVACRQSELAGDRVLRVAVREFSVSGYDFFFFRRPSASITLDGWLESHRGYPARYCQVTHSSSSTRQFAFAPELSRVLDEVLEASAKELFECLRL